MGENTDRLTKIILKPAIKTIPNRNMVKHLLNGTKRTQQTTEPRKKPSVPWWDEKCSSIITEWKRAMQNIQER